MFGVKKIILTAIVFALWGGLIFVLAKNHYCSSEQNKIAKLTKNCKENYDQAQCYLAILNKYDSNYTKFNYGVSLFKAKKYSESIDEFNKIISKPHDENTKYHLCKFDNSAIVDASKQNVTKAQYQIDEIEAKKISTICRNSACYDKYLSKSPKNNQLKLLYGISLMEEDNIDKATKVINEYMTNEIFQDKKLSAQKLLAQKHTQHRDNNIKKSLGAKSDYMDKYQNYSLIKEADNIKVYVEKSPKRNLALDAFKTWDIALGDSVNFSFIEEEKEADITLNFEDKKLEDTFSDSDGSASTKLSGIYTDTKTSKQYHNKAQIEINYRNPKTRKQYSDKELRASMLHEIAHALGVTHHSTNKGDILYPKTYSKTNKNYAFSLSKRDINTVKKMYEN